MGKKKTSKADSKPSSRIYLEKLFDQAEDLINNDDPSGAIELLTPLTAKYSQNTDLQYLLGYAHVKAGNLWNALTHYRNASVLSRDPELWIPLGYLYLDLGLHALGVQALRRVLLRYPTHPMVLEAQEALQYFEGEIRMLASSLGITEKEAEEGLRWMEEGQIALHEQNYSHCIYVNQKAIKLLKDFPASHNNLTLALFFHGKPQQAIETAQQVLANHPGNIQALANLVRFLAWTGEEGEARACWRELRQQTPDNADLRMKMIEAAAIIEDDEMVFRLTKELGPEKEETESYAQTIKLYRAIAEANLGLPSARRRLSQLREEHPLAGLIWQALKDGKSGLGWTQRFPYFHATELLPGREMEALIQLFIRNEKKPYREYRRDIERFAARFPQVVLVGKKFLLENQQVEEGIRFLTEIGTPAAYATLREFGLSQIGSDEARMQALLALLDAEQIQPSEWIQVWQKGEWQPVQLRRYEVVDDDKRDYSPEGIVLLNRGLEAVQKGNDAEAEKLLLRAIEVEPRAKEAFNNLGTIYTRQKNHERAKIMFQKALEIDPLYVLPRCNLAMYLLDDDQVEPAEAMIEPLAGLQQFTPQALSFLSYVRARIALSEEQYDEARSHLKMALQVKPDFEGAKDLLQWIESVQLMKEGFGRWQARAEKSRKAARARLQKQLTTPAPTLEEALGIYTKEAMTGMSRAITPWGGWSALKKAELHAYLVKSLQDTSILSELMASLSEQEQQALQEVLKQGGTMTWDQFEAKFGNDMEDSPYWQYHQPESLMGRLRVRGLLVEATADGELILTIPMELRELLKDMI